MDAGTLWASFFDHFVASIREDILLELELLLLTFATGIEDAATYLEYHCFTSNQTGNTVVLVMSVTGVSGVLSTPLTAASLISFVLAAWINGQLGNKIGRRRRLWIVVSSSIQTALVLAGSGLEFGWNQESSAITLGVIGLLGFSSGSQVSMVRSLHIHEISTANATSTYVDLVIDEDLYKLYNRKRNRRILFILTLCLGSITGAFIFINFQAPTTLLVSAVGKLMVTILFLFNKKIDTVDEKQRHYSSSDSSIV